MTDYTFRTFDGTVLGTDTAEMFSYPMGDATVRGFAQGSFVARVLRVHTARPDWSVVGAWSDGVRELDPNARRVLVLPYLPSARGDKDTPAPARVNARLCAATGITDLVCLDPHSHAWLDTFREAAPTAAVHEIPLDDLVAAVTAEAGNTYAGVIGPDKGSVDRATQVARRLNLPVHICSKHRDPDTGKLSHYEAPQEVLDNPGAYLVVDDICDGGGTFLLLADSVSDDHVLDLWVSHGGFTKGFGLLTAGYRSILTTDSLVTATADATEWAMAEHARQRAAGVTYEDAIAHVSRTRVTVPLEAIITETLKGLTK